MENIKQEFPIFKNNPELVYLDSSATNQRPQVVLDAIYDYYTKYNANVHRGIYPISEQATDAYELAREKLARLIGADTKEVIFTGGVTDSINGLAQSLSKSGMLGANPRIVTTPLEHHSNILPWQSLAPQSIHYLEVDDDFQAVIDPNDPKLKDADLFAIQHSSNVTGTLNDLESMVELAREAMPNAIIVIDAAQSLSHFPIDVKKVDIDFMAFSGHKSYGPTGVGALYGKLELLERMEPFRSGGGMIKDVHEQHATWADVPEKFEAGTPNIAQVIGFGAAVDFISSFSMEKIQEHEAELAEYTLEALSEIDGIQIFHPQKAKKKAGVISFHIDGVHPHDIAHIAGEENVCIRAGHHCCQLLHKQILDVPATNRISLAIFNSKQDIEKAVNTVNKAVNTFRG